MSGFLSRVAARAVGQAPLARPRLPSVFVADHAEAGLEVVETQVLSRPAPRAESQAAEPTPAGQRSAEAVAGETRPPARPPAGPTPEAAPVRMRETETPLRRSEPPVEREPVAVPAEPAVGGEPPAAVDLGRELVAQAEPASVAAAAAAVATARTTLELRLRASAAQAVSPTTATAFADEPAVRVHIGRLEVRANLQEPPRERPRRAADPGPQGPSLSDYLRGGRR